MDKLLACFVRFDEPEKSSKRSMSSDGHAGLDFKVGVWDCGYDLNEYNTGIMV